MRVLIIGGYGNFGFRLARLLADKPGLQVTLVGRNLDKAKAACARLNPAKAEFIPHELNRLDELAPQIKSSPDVIVDTSGPFQTYGNHPYHVVEYAVNNGCHYLDIADSAEFVAGIFKYDEAAKAAGIIVISGLSTYPCLTSAVYLACKDRFETVTDIRAGIAPSPKAGLGRNVIKAITTYAGKPIPEYRNGTQRTTYGLTNGFKYRIAPPGVDPLDVRLFSNVEAPETRLWPEAFPELTTVWLGAGPKPLFMHRCLIGLSKAVRWKLLPGLSGLSGLMAWGLSLFTAGAHRGGMFVELTGTANSEDHTRTWHLVAEGDDGPNIPVIPVAITLSKMLAGDVPSSGARSAVGVVSLREYENVFNQFNIQTGTRDSFENFDNLYARALGASYLRLPKTLQDLHRIKETSTFKGQAKVTRGKSPIAWLTGLVFRFPKTTKRTPIKVVLSENDGIETWERFFGERRMVSLQEMGTGRWSGLIVERFGPVAIAMAACVKDDRMHIITKGWTLFGIPLPRWLAPGGEIFEEEVDGKFRFHVDICAPLFGRLVKYEGWLRPTVE